MAIDYFDEEDEIVPAGATLERLRELADDVTLLEAEIADDTLALAKKAERLKKMTHGVIPGIMDELQIKSFKLTDGSELLVEDKVQASIKAENKDKAYSWLSKYGFDGIIKTNVNAEFGKGDIESAKKALQALQDAGFTAAELSQSIHASTLLSFVKERLAAAGEEIPLEKVDKEDGFNEGEENVEQTPNLPLDIFTVFEFKQAKIKVAKAKKKK